jgi:hypothetical protein
MRHRTAGWRVYELMDDEMTKPSRVVAAVILIALWTLIGAMAGIGGWAGAGIGIALGLIVNWLERVFLYD